MKLNPLNKSELIVGGILGLGFFWYIGIWCIPLAIIISFLWAAGGAGWMGTKAWRRVGVPTEIVLAIHPITWTTILMWLPTWGLCTLGYGTRSYDSTGKLTDPGSPLGNFWLDRLGSRWGMIASRATIITGIWIVWIFAQRISF